MKVPYVRGVIRRLNHAAVQVPALLRGFSGSGLKRHIARGTFAERDILAWRPFGFGSRMGELLNARRLASALGARFVFHWPPEPLFDVEAVEAVFAPDFVAEHHLQTLNIDEFGRLATTIEPRDLLGLAKGPRRGSRMAERYEIRFAGRGLALPSFREAFDRTRFHTDLERIRAAASELPPIGLAVHVRRWDALVPTMRFGGVYSPKLIPTALVDRVVAEFRRGASGEVLLVGNDSGLVDELATTLDAHTPADLLPDAARSLQQEAFRDFCLLARTGSVLGGRSAFARVAQLVAGSREILPEAVISVSEMRDLLWTAAMNPTVHRPLEATLASDHLFQRPDMALTLAEEISLLEQTIGLDPEDPTRWLGLLVRLARVGDRRRASRVMAGIAERFDGRETEVAAHAFRSRTPADRPAHLTDSDWRDLVDCDVVVDPWVEALRGAE